MSTKLNAEELRESAMDYMGWDVDTEMGELYTPTRKSMIADLVGFASSEVAQPLADELAQVKSERDELRGALKYMVSIGEDQGWTDDFLEIPRTILAKYPKP